MKAAFDRHFAPRVNAAAVALPVRFFIFLLAIFLLTLGSGCKDKGQSKGVAPLTQGANEPPPASSTSKMFQQMKERRKLPPPPTEEGDEANAMPQGMPSLIDDFEKSPECKALEADQKALRGKIENLSQTTIAKLAEASEDAYESYMECQDDPGCINDIKQFESKQAAYQRAQRAMRSAEREQEKMETQLYGISKEISKKCDTNPL